MPVVTWQWWVGAAYDVTWLSAMHHMNAAIVDIRLRPDQMLPPVEWLWLCTFSRRIFLAIIRKHYVIYETGITYMVGQKVGPRHRLMATRFLDKLVVKCILKIPTHFATWHREDHRLACSSQYRRWSNSGIFIVLSSVDQSRGSSVYLWHCDQVTSRRRLSKDTKRHFCLTVLTITCLQCFDAVGWAAGRASGL